MSKYNVFFPYFAKNGNGLDKFKYDDLGSCIKFSEEISTLIRDNYFCHAQLSNLETLVRFSAILYSYDKKENKITYYCKNHKNESIVLCEISPVEKDNKFLKDFVEITGIKPEGC